MHGLFLSLLLSRLQLASLSVEDVGFVPSGKANREIRKFQGFSIYGEADGLADFLRGVSPCLIASAGRDLEDMEDSNQLPRYCKKAQT